MISRIREFLGLREEAPPPKRRRTSPKLLSLKEERERIGERLKEARAELEEVEERLAGLSKKSIRQQKKEAKKRLILLREKRRKIERAQMTGRLKFAISRYERVTGNKKAAEMLDEFARSPLKHAHRVGLADTLEDLLESIKEGTVPTREVEKAELVGILEKLGKDKLKRLADVEEKIREGIRENGKVLEAQDPLEELYRREERLEQGVKNLENELELVSMRIRQEMEK